MKILLRLVFMTLSISLLKAQTIITTPNPVMVYDTRFTTKDFYLRGIDTTLDNFHRYNPVLNWETPHIALSNLAQAPRPLQFSPEKYVGYVHGYHLFNRYFYSTDSVRYYNTKTPFTSARYINGAKEETVVNVIHSQNIGPNVNLGFDYQRLVQDGFYNRNKAGIHNFNLFNWYRSRNNKYNLMAAYVFNQVKSQENGGVDADDIFTNSAYQRDLRTIPIQLADAENRIDNNSISIRQSIFLGPTYTRKINDSLEVQAVNPKYAFTHHLQYGAFKIRYTDEERDSTYYQNFFIYADSTRDFTRSWTLMNDFAFQHFAATPDDSAFNARQPVWRTGIRYLLNKWEQQSDTRFLHGIQLYGGIQTNPYLDSKWKYSLNGTLELAPEYAGDFLTEANVLYQISEKSSLEPSVSINLQTPAYRWGKTLTNHYQWENAFKKTLISDAGLTYRLNPWRLETGIQYQMVQRYVYLEENSQPNQLDDALHVIRATLKKDFNWKRFYMSNKLSAQWVSDNDIIRMPVFYLHQQLYYRGSYIKKKPIHAQFGLDLTYFTNHYGDAYNPALMAFFVQRRELLRYYPIIDVFFNLQVKRARIFFQMQHINQGLFEGGYYASPNYPAAPRAFKLGVSWQFYD